MSVDNQLGEHSDLWSYCFPEGIVHTVSSNHLWFQCFRLSVYLQINANGNTLIQNEIAHYFHMGYFPLFTTREKMWVDKGFCPPQILGLTNQSLIWLLWIFTKMCNANHNSWYQSFYRTETRNIRRKARILHSSPVHGAAPTINCRSMVYQDTNAQRACKQKMQ